MFVKINFPDAQKNGFVSKSKCRQCLGAPPWAVSHRRRAFLYDLWTSPGHSLREQVGCGLTIRTIYGFNASSSWMNMNRIKKRNNAIIQSGLVIKSRITIVSDKCDTNMTVHDLCEWSDKSVIRLYSKWLFMLIRDHSVKKRFEQGDKFQTIALHRRIIAGVWQSSWFVAMTQKEKLSTPNL